MPRLGVLFKALFFPRFATLKLWFRECGARLRDFWGFTTRRLRLLFPLFMFFPLARAPNLLSERSVRYGGRMKILRRALLRLRFCPKISQRRFSCFCRRNGTWLVRTPILFRFAFCPGRIGFRYAT